jgi:hypothetical protein
MFSCIIAKRRSILDYISDVIIFNKVEMHDACRFQRASCLSYVPIRSMLHAITASIYMHGIILQSILHEQSMIRNIVFVFKRVQRYTRLCMWSNFESTL